MKRIMSVIVLSIFAVAAVGSGSSEDSSAPSNTEGTPQPVAAENAEANEPANTPAAAPTNTTYTCNQVGSNHLCYTIAPMAALVPGNQSGCEMPGGTWTEGESCPSDGVVATCTKDMNDEVRRFYAGATLSHAETACTMFGGTFATTP